MRISRRTLPSSDFAQHHHHHRRCYSCSLFIIRYSCLKCKMIGRSSCSMTAFHKNAICNWIAYCSSFVYDLFSSFCSCKWPFNHRTKIYRSFRLYQYFIFRMFSLIRTRVDQIARTQRHGSIYN